MATCTSLAVETMGSTLTQAPPVPPMQDEREDSPDVEEGHPLQFKSDEEAVDWLQRVTGYEDEAWGSAVDVNGKLAFYPMQLTSALTDEELQQFVEDAAEYEQSCATANGPASVERSNGFTDANNDVSREPPTDKNEENGKDYSVEDESCVGSDDHEDVDIPTDCFTAYDTVGDEGDQASPTDTEEYKHYLDKDINGIPDELITTSFVLDYVLGDEKISNFVLPGRHQGLDGIEIETSTASNEHLLNEETPYTDNGADLLANDDLSQLESNQINGESTAENGDKNFDENDLIPAVLDAEVEPSNDLITIEEKTEDEQENVSGSDISCIVEEMCDPIASSSEMHTEDSADSSMWQIVEDEIDSLVEEKRAQEKTDDKSNNTCSDDIHTVDIEPVVDPSPNNQEKELSTVETSSVINEIEGTSQPDKGKNASQSEKVPRMKPCSVLLKRLRMPNKSSQSSESVTGEVNRASENVDVPMSELKTELEGRVETVEAAESAGVLPEESYPVIVQPKVKEEPLKLPTPAPNGVKSIIQDSPKSKADSVSELPSSPKSPLPRSPAVGRGRKRKGRTSSVAASPLKSPKLDAANVSTEEASTPIKSEPIEETPDSGRKSGRKRKLTPAGDNLKELKDATNIDKKENKKPDLTDEKADPTEEISKLTIPAAHNVARTESKKANPDFARLSAAMDRTYERYRKTVYDKNNTDVNNLLRMPGLRHYQMVKEEYGRILGDKQKMKVLEDELTDPITKALEPKDTKKKGKLKTRLPNKKRHPLWDQALSFWEQNKTNETAKKNIGLLIVCFEFCESAVPTHLFMLLQEGEKPNPNQISTPRIVMKEEDIFKDHTEVTLYVEGKKYIQVPNIYEAMLCAFSLHYILNISYPQKLKPFFEFLDLLNENSQTTYSKTKNHS